VAWTTRERWATEQKENFAWSSRVGRVAAGPAARSERDPN